VATHGRTTQTVVETLGAGAGAGRTTQTVVETLGAGAGAARTTQTVIEVLGVNTVPVNAGVTQTTVEVLAQDPNVSAAITHSAVEVMAAPVAVETRVSNYSVELLVPFNCPTFCPPLPPVCPVPTAAASSPNNCDNPVPQEDPSTPGCVTPVPPPDCPTA
jgi:hypothetical protein